MTELTGRQRNGNTVRVLEICDALYEQHGEDLQRSMVLEASKAEGIPKGTASSMWQVWRTRTYEAASE